MYCCTQHFVRYPLILEMSFFEKLELLESIVVTVVRA
jgi:hypothetical protein